MKNKRLIGLGIVLAIILIVSIWWIMPKTFLNNVETESVEVIEVFDGNNGHRLQTTSRDDISYIVSNIKDIKMKKEKIQLGMGTTYTLRFFDKSGKELDKFIINAPNIIIKGVIHYTCDNELKEVMEYLIDLENKAFPNDRVKWNENY